MEMPQVIEIEATKIPIPSHPGERVRKYPFDLLKVGQSFFVPNRSAAEISASKSQAIARTKYEFVVRRAELDGATGIRVWRTK